jgi:RHS repeat-associated protein
VPELESGVTEEVYGADKVLNPDALLKVAQAAGPQVLESNRWDASNRLIGNTNAYGDITTYKYDGDGNRVSMRTTIGDGAIQDAYLSSNPAGNRDGWEPQYKKRQIDIYFTNDITMSIPQPLMATGADGQNWKQSYVYGAGEERISMSYLVSEDESNDWEPADGASGAGAAAVAPKTLYYLSDAQGSVIGLEGQDGSISARYRYDEFGIAENPEKFDLNWSGPDNLFGYTSLGYDYYSGYSHAQARDFDSSIGRFISEDTYEGELNDPLSLNMYTYVSNNPLRYTDPSGHIKNTAYFEIELMLDEAMTLSKNSKQYLEYKSQLGSTFRKIYKDKNNNRFKYLYGLLTQTSSYKNSAGNASWAKGQLLEALDAHTDRTWELGVSAEVILETATSGVAIPKNKNGTIKIKNSGGCNCFVAGTKVQTDEVEKNIEDIEVGDKVLAKDEVTGEVAYKEVTATFNHETDEIYKIHVGDQVIESTYNHPFYVEDKGWTFVKDLKVGDLLVQSDGNTLKIESIELEHKHVTVYNMTVDEFHTYFVSDLGIWVHNTNCFIGGYINKNEAPSHVKVRLQQ